VKHFRHPPNEKMHAAFLQALKRRVVRDNSGQVILPTGIVDADELTSVLIAIERARDEQEG